MNTNLKRARRYHWFGNYQKDFIHNPHSAIVSQIFLPSVLNLTSNQSQENRETGLKLVQSPKVLLKDIKILTIKKGDWQFRLLSLPVREFYYHPIQRETFNLESPQFRQALNKALSARPSTFEQLLMTEGVGPKTIRAISLVAEIIYGAKPSYEDPARYTFAHGGKDGIPYPVDRKVYDQTLSVVEKAIKQISGLTIKEKSKTLWRAEKAFGILRQTAKKGDVV
jgi:hypothetical protein